MTKIIAHRGASAEAPENTIKAIQRAIDLHVDFIEIDVHLTQDHVPVLLHDSHINRTTNATKILSVEEMSRHALKEFDAGSWFSPHFAGETIPTLDEVLALQRGSTGLMIELKRGKADPAKLVAAVIQSLHRAAVTPENDKIIIGSFSIEILHEMQKQAPEFAIIGNVQDIHLLQTFHDHNFGHLALWRKLFTHALMDDLHSRGCEVWTFTVDDPHEARALISIGVDGIITNDPGNLKKIFALNA